MNQVPHTSENGNPEISRYLTSVWEDWRASRQDFPENTIATPHWPIPFFGNPSKATVATIGVNPSSGEFASDRQWASVEERSQWKCRLRDYFNLPVPPHAWFNPWSAGLQLLGVQYQDGSAVHIDVSYRTTTAMLRNKQTDPAEFRHMVERDVQWLFRLLPLCPNLSLLLTFGRIVCEGGSLQRLFIFIMEQAPKHGFKVIQDGQHWTLRHDATGRTFSVHDADTDGIKDVAVRVKNNLEIHRQELLRRLASGQNHSRDSIPAVASFPVTIPQKPTPEPKIPDKPLSPPNPFRSTLVIFFIFLIASGLLVFNLANAACKMAPRETHATIWIFSSIGAFLMAIIGTQQLLAALKRRR